MASRATGHHPRAAQPPSEGWHNSWPSPVDLHLPIGKPTALRSSHTWKGRGTPTYRWSPIEISGGSRLNLPCVFPHCHPMYAEPPRDGYNALAVGASSSDSVHLALRQGCSSASPRVRNHPSLGLRSSYPLIVETEFRLTPRGTEPLEPLPGVRFESTRVHRMARRTGGETRILERGSGFFAVRVNLPCRVWLSVEGPGGASASVAWAPHTPDTHMCRKDMDPGPGRAYRTTDVFPGLSHARHGGNCVRAVVTSWARRYAPLYAGGGPSSGPRNATREHHVN